MAEQKRVFVHGVWISLSTDDAVDVISTHTEDVIAAARATCDEGLRPRHDPAERIDAVRRLSAAIVPDDAGTEAVASGIRVAAS